MAKKIGSKIGLENVINNIDNVAKDLREANIFSHMVIKGMNVLYLKFASQGKYEEERRNLLERLAREFKPNLDYIERIIHTWASALKSNGYLVKVCVIKARSRCLIGVSEAFGKIPFEVGLAFDPVLNTPLIPGSTLKGAFRHALLNLVERRYGRKKAEEIVNEVFGSREGVGLVGVTDAYPVSLGIGGRVLEPDVITPHYPGAKTELDVKPNPILFLTIAPGVRFKFLIYFNKNIFKWEADRRGGKRGIGIVRDNELRLKNVDVLSYGVHYGSDLGEAIKRLGKISIEVVPWIDRAVLYAFAKGVGAKTSLSYSRFEVIRYESVR